MSKISRQNLLIIGTVWPEPNSSAAGRRMMQLIGWLIPTYSITFCSAAAKSDYMENLEQLGVSTTLIQLNSSEFDDFVSALNPAMVIFDRFLSEEQFGWRIARCCPNALRVLDLEDLHSLRRAREKALRKNKNLIPGDLLGEDDAKREIAAIFRSDLTLVISDYEMKLLTEDFKVPDFLLFYLPLTIDAGKALNVPSFQHRRNFAFIGNFLHEPNADAVNYLRKIWPEIRAVIPDATLNIYGAYPSLAMMQLTNPKLGFFVHGRADDAKAVIERSRVVLAPLRFGAGIKGKLIEAMQLGTPSVTTKIGAEGINANLPWSGFVADDAERFVGNSIELYTDENIWTQAQRNGFEILAKRFSPGDFRIGFLAKITALRDDLSQHRTQNFIGAMLQYHLHRSTEFFSRWIEEKNKPR